MISGIGGNSQSAGDGGFYTLPASPSAPNARTFPTSFEEIAKLNEHEVAQLSTQCLENLQTVSPTKEAETCLLKLIEHSKFVPAILEQMERTLEKSQPRAIVLDMLEKAIAKHIYINNLFRQTNKCASPAQFSWVEGVARACNMAPPEMISPQLRSLFAQLPIANRSAFPNLLFTKKMQCEFLDRYLDPMLENALFDIVDLDPPLNRNDWLFLAKATARAQSAGFSVGDEIWKLFDARFGKRDWQSLNKNDIKAIIEQEVPAPVIDDSLSSKARDFVDKNYSMAYFSWAARHPHKLSIDEWIALIRRSENWAKPPVVYSEDLCTVFDNVPLAQLRPLDDTQLKEIIVAGIKQSAEYDREEIEDRGQQWWDKYDAEPVPTWEEQKNRFFPSFTESKREDLRSALSSKVKHFKRVLKCKEFYHNQLSLDEENIFIPRWFHVSGSSTSHSRRGHFDAIIKDGFLKKPWLSEDLETDFGDTVLSLSEDIQKLDALPNRYNDRSNRWREVRQERVALEPRRVLIGLSHTSGKTAKKIAKCNLFEQLQSLHSGEWLRPMSIAQVIFLRNLTVRAIGTPNLDIGWWYEKPHT